MRSKRRRVAILPAALVAGTTAIALAALGATPPATETPQAINWARARDINAAYRTVVDSSGLVEIAGASRAVDPTDLAGLCTARQEVVGSARGKVERELRELGQWRDPISDEKRSALFRLLGVAASFEGDMDTAARQFGAARDLLAAQVEDYPDLRPRLLVLDEVLGVAHMRRGEIDNCLVNPSTDRCLFPVRPGGHHHRPQGAEDARQSFEAYLARDPKDLEVRWLLNLAYMVLGRYPQDVPREQLLSPDLFKSEIEMPRLLDVSAPAGIGRMDIAGGTIADDFDGDGLPDVVFSSVDRCSPLRLYRSRGNGTFQDVSEAAGILGQLGGLNVVQTDYNNDGRLDIYVMRGGWEVPMRNSLLRNDGNGAFTDVTREAGLLSGAHATHSAAWADFDNDGWLDVFVGHELTPSQLFRNRGDGTFEDVTARAGVGKTAFTKGATWGDYDNDGWRDLYVSNMFGENFLYHANGDGTFTDVAAKLGVQKPLTSFTTWFFDYDNDGWLDLFVVSFPPSVAEFVKHYLKMPPLAETLTLYRNNGDGTFADVSARLGLDRVVPAMGANFGDLDNDGYLDVYLGTGAPSLAALMPNIMLKNDGGRRFLDVTETTGTGHLQKGHAIAFTDLDNDGDEEVILNVGGAVPGDRYQDAVFLNPGGFGNNWISLKLVGVKTNRAALGARIRLTLPSADEGSNLRYREVTSGSSFGASSLAQHIGLGKASKIATLEIHWPVSRTTQTFHDVPVNRFLEIRELETAWRERKVPRFSFARRTPDRP
ncbi:MAG TPA: CRTAC1 family protein [Vicinamibacteria bacterium]